MAAGAAGDGSAATVALGGVGDVPLRLALTPDDKVDDLVAAAQELLTDGQDHLANLSYRRRLLDVALRDALARVPAPATAGAAA